MIREPSSQADLNWAVESGIVTEHYGYPPNRSTEMQTAAIDPSYSDRREQSDRRSFSSKTLYYGVIRSRRRHARRENDHLTTYMDWYQGKLMLFALGILLLSVTDAVLTLHLISNGASEVNPVMNYFLNQGIQIFVSAKMLMTAVPLVLLTAASNYALFNRLRIASIFPVMLGSYMMLFLYELFLIFSI